ncbi:MAG: sulfite dehydrogenase, partial [Methyloversatilis sp. 12-65-5]
MARNPNDHPDQPRVGEGRLDRRGFLKQGAALAAVTTPAGAQATQAGGDLPWLHVPGQPFSAYGQPSPHERYTARRIGA